MKRQKGISLLEVLLSLSIIAIILVMATRYFFVASNNDRINQVRQQVGELVAAIHSWKGQNAHYDSTLTVSQLYNDGFLAKSSSLVVSGGSATLYDPWGGQITLTGNSTNATISLSLPSHNDCVALKNGYATASCDAGEGNFTLTVQ